ncbi:MAG TPA: hydrogenase expression/formation protein HypE [Rhodocyclaceae bacterium]|nr:hydrogenase expression/formation protein HypE [Rhodocyclaceae bacterium]
MKSDYIRPLDIKHGRVDMSHGSGGRAMAQLIEELFAKHLSNEYLAQGDDGARLPAVNGRLVMSTDAHVVSPLFFPGGDIGCLSVHGTINDVAVMGATPLYLAAGFVLEEGFALADLARIVESMAQAAKEAGVPIVTGDTKVVEAGKADGVFITTTGVGVLRQGVDLSGANARPGDAVFVSGPIGDHGTAVMVARGELALEVDLESDTAPVAASAQKLCALGTDLRWMRDPTRGGLATALNELAQQSGLAISIDEHALPVRPEVAGTCEILGIDPLYVACEGRLIAVIASGAVERALSALGAEAADVGEVRAEPEGLVLLQTTLGGSRVVDMLVGDPLPRIC